MSKISITLTPSSPYLLNRFSIAIMRPLDSNLGSFRLRSRSCDWVIRYNRVLGFLYLLGSYNFDLLWYLFSITFKNKHVYPFVFESPHFAERIDTSVSNDPFLVLTLGVNDWRLGTKKGIVTDIRKIYKEEYKVSRVELIIFTTYIF